MRQPELSGDFAKVMAWADEHRTLGVRANADTPRDAAQAREFGAEGIGLCRTEHMFFEADRILAVREMICADDEAGPAPRAGQDPAHAARRLRGAVRDHGRPAGDHPPARPAAARVPAARRQGGGRRRQGARRAAAKAARTASRELHEFNPMLGFRGCRLAIRYPEITEMQARAIFEAAVNAGRKTGRAVVPEVMIPLVAWRARVRHPGRRDPRQRRLPCEKETGAKLDYQIGTMIELPRAALKADEIAAGDAGAEFFSFGTNDLTQTCLGLSRDDAAPILADYAERAIFEVDPFVSIDHDGVGELVTSAPSAAAACGRTSRSASAASTAATRHRSPSATRRGWTTSPARPSGCRSRGWPQRRRPSGQERQGRRPAPLEITDHASLGLAILLVEGRGAMLPRLRDKSSRTSSAGGSRKPHAAQVDAFRFFAGSDKSAGDGGQDCDRGPDDDPLHGGIASRDRRRTGANRVTLGANCGEVKLRGKVVYQFEISTPRSMSSIAVTSTAGDAGLLMRGAP